MRWFVLLILMINTLMADGISDEALGPILTEASWFVAVIAVMGVISFVVSSRNAKKYAEKIALEKKDEIAVEKEAEATYSELALNQNDSEVDRLLELSKLHKEGLLSKKEFMAFKMKLYREIESIHV